MSRTITPPALAKLWHISPEKVITWIRSGELPAVNVATHATGRPRYIISEDDLKVFEAKRSVIAKTKPARRRSRLPELMKRYV